MNKFRANFLYQFSYQILAILLPLITAPYVSRVLGANGIGEYAYTNTVAYYFYVLCMSGIDTHGQRVVASNQTNKRKRSEKFWEIYAFQVIITLAGSVIYWAYVFFFSKEKLLLSALQYFYVASAFGCLKE